MTKYKVWLSFIGTLTITLHVKKYKAMHLLCSAASHYQQKNSAASVTNSLFTSDSSFIGFSIYEVMNMMVCN